MKARNKSLIVSATVFIMAFVSYFTFGWFVNGIPPSIGEGLLFTLYHGILDALAVFIVTYILFKVIE